MTEAPDASFVARLTEALIQNGGDVAAALESLNPRSEPPAQIELRQRLSLARWLDADLYGMLAADDAEAPSFDMVTGGETPLLAPFGPLRRCGGERWTWTSDAALTAAERWAEADPPAFREWHGRIAAWLHERLGHEAQADIVYHLAVSDPDAAAEVFGGYWAEADRQYDTARMHNLLEVLHSQARWHSPKLAQAWEAAQQYARSRALFHDHYLRTTTFLERRTVWERFAAFLDEPDRWIFQMHATGGAGKSMFLRWLISHKLVPEPDRVPCAYFDFDFDFNKMAELLASPAKALFAILDQIDQQLPQARLSHVLSEFRTAMADPAWRMEDLLERLSDIRIDDRVLVVLDTVEEPMLSAGPFLLGLIGHLDRIRIQTMPGLRLLIAGRYDLSERLKGFPDDDALNYELPRFTRTEAEDYLKLRHLEDPALNEAVLRRAIADHDDMGAFNPFKLSLLAELVLGRDGMTPADVAALPRIDVAYLIERVIRRIGFQSLRWLVRYAAVAQDATPEFVGQVLLPELRMALAGRSQGDSPNSAPDIRRYPDGDLWTPSPEELRTLSPETLHEALVGYARERGWISVNADQSIRLHPEVVAPMRRLLRAQAVFDELHARAQRYYQGRAAQASSDEAWADATVRALFHAFQRVGPDAEPLWRRARRDALTRGTAARVEIARAVLGKDFAEAEADPLPLADGDPRPIVTRQTLCDAHMAVARELFDSHVVAFDPRDPAWQRVTHHIERATAIAALLGAGERVPPALRALGDALAGMAAGETQIAADDPPAAPGTPDAIRWQLLAAGLASSAEPVEALKRYAAVQRLLPRPRGELMVERAEILRRQASVLEASGRFAPASEILRRASALSGTDEAERRRYCLQRADLALGAHDLGLAADQIAAAEAAGPTETADLLQRRLALALASWDYGGAAEFAARLLSQSETLPPAERIWARCAAAQAAVGLYDRHMAVLHFDQAMQEAVAHPDEFPPLAILLVRVEAALDYLRSPALARSMLDSASSAAVTSRVAAFRRRYDLLRVRTELMAGAREAAFFVGQRSLLGALAEPEMLPPHGYYGWNEREAQFALVLVMLANGMPEMAGKSLTALLRALRARRRILPILDLLGDCTGPIELEYSEREALLRLVPAPDPDPALGGVDLIRIADLHRVLGDHDTASAILTNAPQAEFARRPERAFAWELARERTGLATDFIALERTVAQSALAESGLHAAIRTRAAREMLARGDLEDAEAALRHVRGHAVGLNDESGWLADAFDLQATLYERTDRHADALQARTAAAEQRWLCDLPRKAADLAVEHGGSSNWVDLALMDIGATRSRIVSIVGSNRPERRMAAENPVESRNLARLMLDDFKRVHTWLGDQLLLPRRVFDAPIVLPMPAADPLREVARLPWELAAGLDDQPSIVRCPVGPAAPLPPSRPGQHVLVLAHRADGYRRGSYSLSGLDADMGDMYRSAGGISATVLDPTKPEPLDVARRGPAVDVIHIVATLRSGSQGLVLDFSSDEKRIVEGYEHDELLLTSHQLKRWLTQVASRPLVILDIVPPRNPVAAIEMLFQRNAFADDLYDPRLMRGVLATGLAVPEQRPAIMHALLETLGSGASMLALLASLRRQRSSWYDTDVEQLLLPLASALWSVEPGQPALRPENSSPWS